MSSYSRIKSISKSLVLLSLVAVVFSGGAFLFQKSKIGADTSVLNSINYLTISVNKSEAVAGDTVVATIEVTNPSTTDPNKQIGKVIMYACTGSANSISSGTSMECTWKNSDGQVLDAIKKVFEPIPFTNNRATLRAEWKTSGSSTGDHAIMIKAFNNNTSGNTYIPNLKAVIPVHLTAPASTGTGTTATTTGSPSTETSTITGLTVGSGEPASENPDGTGSPIRDIETLVDTIIKIILIFIGAFSVISIIVGGIFYISSGGDQAKAEKGKKTIIYAIFGIVIATLGFVIEVAVLDIVRRLLR